MLRVRSNFLRHRALIHQTAKQSRSISWIHRHDIHILDSQSQYHPQLRHSQLLPYTILRTQLEGAEGVFADMQLFSFLGQEALKNELVCGVSSELLCQRWHGRVIILTPPLREWPVRVGRPPC
jgi:hypothetical protein